MAQPRRKRRESFGQVEKLPSGRIRARYTGPDGHRYTAPVTFGTVTDARAWLSQQQAKITADEWQPARKRSPIAFRAYAEDCIATRTNAHGEPLKPRTRREYERLITGPLHVFHDRPLHKITPEEVRRWNAAQLATGKVTQTARAYRVLRSVMATALADGHIKANPCQLRGAAKAATGRPVEPPTDAELAIILATIDPRLSLLVEVAAWGGLRWGEITELRRGDVRITGDIATLSITRAVTYTAADGYIVGTPKSAAGIRTVALPDTLTPAIRERLEAIARNDDALLFPALSDPARHLSGGAFGHRFRKAREAAGRPDMPFHALRHFGATRYALAGATTKELLTRLGHSHVAVAMRYQHDAGRDADLARAMRTTKPTPEPATERNGD